MNIGYRCEENYDVNDFFRVLTKKEISPYYRLAIVKHIQDNEIHRFDKNDIIVYDVYYTRTLDVTIHNPNDDTYEVYKICNNLTPVSDIIENICFICKNNKELNPMDITKCDPINVRLNCLLFYIQGYCLGMYGVPLFKDSLYYNTDNVIVKGILFKDQEQVVDVPTKLNKDVDGLVKCVIDLMGKYTDEYLIDNIKKDIELMKYDTNKPGIGFELDHNTMRKYFAKYVEDK